MRPTIEELHQSDHYRLIDSFKIDELNQFIARELGLQKPSTNARKPISFRRRLMGIIFFLVMAGIGGIIGYGIGTYLGGRAGSDVYQALADRYAWQLPVGLLGFFVVLLPLHEFIHGVTFKQIGAPKVGYGWSWKALAVYAYAQRYVHTARELMLVAMMPFVVITSLLLVAWLVLPAYTALWAMLLFLHTTGCIGDFVLINYARKHPNLYTYDDIEVENRSYYFVKQDT